MKNISFICNSNLCIGCGSCFSICPEDAIQWDYVISKPNLDEAQCINCKKCLDVCPSMDIRSTYYETYKNESKYLQGEVIKTILSHSNNDEIRLNGASGGFISQLLIDLLRCNLIDGALITTLKDKEWCQPLSILVQDEEGIIAAKGSKYLKTSPCLSVKNTMGLTGRFAFVGLPCQIVALKKMENIMPGLKDKFILHIGLFCGHVVTKNFYDILAQREQQKMGKPKNIIFRGIGWPGDLEITYDNGDLVKLKYINWIKKYYSSLLDVPYRCLICPDATSELADISVGDPWIKEIQKQQNMGESLVIIRTKKGLNMVESALNIGNLSEEIVPNGIIIESQTSNISFKKYKRPYLESKLVTHLVGKDMIAYINPVGGYNEIRKKSESLVTLCGYYSMLSISKIGNESFLSKVPNSLLKIYSDYIYITILKTMIKVK